MFVDTGRCQVQADDSHFTCLSTGISIKTNFREINEALMQPLAETFITRISFYWLLLLKRERL